MNNIHWQLQDELMPELHRQNLDVCIKRTSEALASLPKSPFHIALDLRIANSLQDVADHFDAFIQKESKKLKLKAIYTETNGFEINTDLWFFDIFGYSSYGGLEDCEWLSNWQTNDYAQFSITGFEELQKVYGSDAYRREEFSDASDMAGLLFTARFQEMIQNASKLMKQQSLPILATSHDSDFIYQTESPNRVGDATRDATSHTTCHAGPQPD